MRMADTWYEYSSYIPSFVHIPSSLPLICCSLYAPADSIVSLAAPQTAHGTGNFLTYIQDFGSAAAAGDFTMTAQMKLFDLDGSAGTFMINDGHFGFEGACQCTFTEGGFFGGVLTNVHDDPQASGFVEGQLMTFRVERRGSTFTFWASEQLVHSYISDVPVTSIGFRPHRATFFVYDWQVIRHD